MIEQLQQFAAGFPEWAQWIAVMLVSAIPFVESYFGSVIGVAIGLHPVVAIAAAVVGNTVSMLVFVLSAHATRSKVRSVIANSNNGKRGAVATAAAGASPAAEPPVIAISDNGEKSESEETPRRQRLRKAFDRFGVPGVSLIGQTFLPSQITSAAMVGFGASKNAVIFWQIISIILWGVVFGTLANLGVTALLS